MTESEQLAVIRDHNMRLRARLLDMLRSPYTGTMSWATTAACLELEHPEVRRNGGCACGERKGPA